METKELNPQYINGPDGKAIGVFLSVQEFNHLVEDLDGLTYGKTLAESELNMMSLAYAEKSFAEGWDVSPAEDEYWNSFIPQRRV
jgi:hypothetical protein